MESSIIARLKAERQGSKTVTFQRPDLSLGRAIVKSDFDYSSAASVCNVSVVPVGDWQLHGSANSLYASGSYAASSSRR